MNFSLIVVVWAIWSIATVAWILAILYQSQITSKEEDQLFLSGTQSLQHQEQDEIIRKVNQLQPIVHTLGITTAVLTVGIIGYYAWDAFQHLVA
jgi:hypothetical protein